MTGARFRQIAQDLRERIALGDLGPGGALDSEAALGERYGTSRITVRSALELIRDEGLVESRKGSGWFAVGAAFQQRLALGTFHHAASAVASAGSALTRTVVSFEFVAAPAHIAVLLAVDPGSDVLSVGSVRETGGAALDRTTEWIARPAADQIRRADAASPGVWTTLQRGGTVIESVRQSITAGVAGDTDHRLLGVAVGAPLLLVRRVAHSATRPLALSDHRYLAHRFSLEVEFAGWSAGGDDSPGLQHQPDLVTHSR